MKAELGTTGVAIALAILLCLLVGISVAIYPGWIQAWEFMDKNFLLSKEAPAWIQAIGSIGAILFSAWLFNSSNREKKKNSLIRARAFSSMLNAAFLGMKDAAQNNQARDIVLCRATMAEALAIGRGIILEELPEECVSPVMSLRSISNAVLSIADIYLLAPNSESAKTLFNVMQGFFLSLSKHNLTISSVHPPVLE